MQFESETQLADLILKAFAKRRIPSKQILRPGFDARIHLEAQRVERFIRTTKKIDRSNSAQSAFIYLTDEAALAILPLYLVSILLEFNIDDYINDVIIEMLASAAQESDGGVRGNIGAQLRALATKDESDAVCCFLKWYYKKAVSCNEIDAEIYGPSVGRAIQLWCDSAKCSDL